MTMTYRLYIVVGSHAVLLVRVRPTRRPPAFFHSPIHRLRSARSASCERFGYFEETWIQTARGDAPQGRRRHPPGPGVELVPADSGCPTMPRGWWGILEPKVKGPKRPKDRQVGCRQANHVRLNEFSPSVALLANGDPCDTLEGCFSGATVHIEEDANPVRT